MFSVVHDSSCRFGEDVSVSSSPLSMKELGKNVRVSCISFTSSIKSWNMPLKVAWQKASLRLKTQMLVKMFFFAVFRYGHMFHFLSMLDWWTFWEVGAFWHRLSSVSFELHCPQTLLLHFLEVPLQSQGFFDFQDQRKVHWESVLNRCTRLRFYVFPAKNCEAVFQSSLYIFECTEYYRKHIIHIYCISEKSKKFVHESG